MKEQRSASTTHRSYERLRAYLEDYRQVRALVWTDFQLAQVDRLYRHDPKIHSWTAHWHKPTGTPYLVRRGQLLFPDGTRPETIQAIQQHHERHCTAGKV